MTAQAHDPGAARQRTYLLRGGSLITMDDRLGDLTGDILVADGKHPRGRAARSTRGDAEIIDAADHLVLPGLIDSHRHTWQSPIRHTGLDWDLPRMFVELFKRFGPNFRPRGRLCGDAVRPPCRARRRGDHAARLGAHPELAGPRRRGDPRAARGRRPHRLCPRPARHRAGAMDEGRARCRIRRTSAACANRCWRATMPW